MAFGNFIFIDSKKYRLYGEPLESYWNTIVKRPPMCSFWHSPYDKGYYAEWELKNSKLFLVEFITENNFFTKCSYTFEDYFGDKKEPFFAEWFCGELSIMEGKVLANNNHHFDAIQEYSFLMMFEKGLLQNTLIRDLIT